MFSCLVHLIPSLSISHPYLITFHDFGDNSQEGMKYQKRGATPASQGMSLRITLFSTMLQGLEPIPETTTWKQLNAINSSFSCDFNKNATPPCSRVFTDDCWLYKGHFRTQRTKPFKIASNYIYPPHTHQSLYSQGVSSTCFSRMKKGLSLPGK